MELSPPASPGTKAARSAARMHSRAWQSSFDAATAGLDDARVAITERDRERRQGNARSSSSWGVEAKSKLGQLADQLRQLDDALREHERKPQRFRPVMILPSTFVD